MMSIVRSKRPLSLRTKVFLWSGVAMVWVVVLGGTGFVFTDQVADVSFSLVEEQAVPMIDIGTAKGIAWEVYVRGIFHAGLTNPAEMAKLDEEIGVLSAQLTSKMEAYGKHAGVSKEWLAALQSDWHDFQEIANKAHVLSRNFAKEEAMQLLVGAGERAFDRVLNAIEVERNRRWQQMTMLRQQSEVTRSRASQWIAGMTLLFGVVVLSGWLYARVVSASLLRVTNVLATAIAQMTATLSEQERIAAHQATAVNETNTTMGALGVSTRQTAEQADVAANSTQAALDFSKQGTARVEETLRSMENAQKRVEVVGQQILLLSEQVGRIREITGMVTDFANETKMLAMNAAVEAVRAGEHGKGFSVLAVETRKLADESKRSAGEIALLVDSIQKTTNASVVATKEGASAWRRGVAITQSTAQTFRSLADVVGTASEGAVQISANVRQQSVAVKQVLVAMQSINTGARESATGISQVKVGIQTLNESARTLRDMI